MPASAIEDIQWGCVKQQGEQGYDVARMAALIAGLPIEVGGVTVNRNCGSSLQAINQAAQSIAANARTCRSPAASSTCTTFRWRPASTPARVCCIATVPATHEHGPDRREPGAALQDQPPRAGRVRAAQPSAAPAEATDSGAFAREIIPTWGRDEEGRRKIMTEDQCIRRDTSLEALAALEAGVHARRRHA